MIKVEECIIHIRLKVFYAFICLTDFTIPMQAI